MGGTAVAMQVGDNRIMSEYSEKEQQSPCEGVGGLKI